MCSSSPTARHVKFIAIESAYLYQQIINMRVAVADPGFFERGFQLLAKAPAQFELKTKEKVMHQPSYSSLIISIRTTVIKVS